MPPKSTNAVGAAILGLPAADSAAVVPQEHTPDSWRASLARKPEAAKVVFQSCTVGRDWVLSTSPKATVQLNCAAEASPWIWHRHVAAVADALRTRGTLPTTLKLRCTETGSCAAQASVVLSALRGVGSGVQALEVHSWPIAPSPADAQPISGLVQCAVQTFSGLKSLKLKGLGDWVIPKPALLPQLQHLTVEAEAAGHSKTSELARSVAAYGTQLSSLRFRTCPGLPILADLLPTPTHTLTHLTVRQDLTDDSLAFLLTQAPALQSLSVGAVKVRTDACQHRVWGVTEFKTTQGGDENERVEAEALARLPCCADGGVTRFELIEERVRFTVNDAKVSCDTHTHTHVCARTLVMSRHATDMSAIATC